MNTQIIETNTVTLRRDLTVGEYFRHPGETVVYQTICNYGSRWNYPCVGVSSGILSHTSSDAEVERLEIIGEPVQFRVKG